MCIILPNPLKVEIPPTLVCINGVWVEITGGTMKITPNLSILFE